MNGFLLLKITVAGPLRNRVAETVNLFFRRFPLSSHSVAQRKFVPNFVNPQSINYYYFTVVVIIISSISIKT